MLYHLQTLLQSHNHIRNNILTMGTLQPGNVYIDLPIDFDFQGNRPDEVTIPINEVKSHLVPFASIEPDYDWPIFLKPFKLLAKENDKGLGDIVKHIIGDTNSEAFKKWYKDNMGTTCGCHERQAWLNKKYPLKR